MVILGTDSALATWSITAVDSETREVGVALASCISGGGFGKVADVVPGVGAITAQASANPEGLQVAMEMLGAGSSPLEVMAYITSAEFDPQPFYSMMSGRQTRQYGIAALGFEEAPATFTGSRTFGWKGTLHGSGVSVQGNILRGDSVVRTVLDAFEVTSTCSLPDRLMLALEAGADAGGDSRCEPELAALSAFIRVARPSDALGAPYLNLEFFGPVDTSSVSRFLRQIVRSERLGEHENAVRRLRIDYDQWRTESSIDVPVCQP